MSKRKSLIAMLLALAMTASLMTGCGKKDEPAGSGSASGAASSSASSSAGSEVVIPEKMEGDEFGNGAIGANAAVVSASKYASEAGVEILKKGGNAVDAAVATIFAVGVCEPNLSGIGGCGMMNIYLADTDEHVILEYMETVPVALEPGMYNYDTDANTARMAAVPSQVKGLLTALEKYGTMSREEVMAPAIKLARDGFPLEQRLYDAIMDNYNDFSEEALSIYTNDGIPYSVGDTFCNKPLAETLQAISDGGMEAFYEGKIAEAMIEGLQAEGSLMSMEDLASYTVAEREPISTTYYGYEVITVPPPSCGGDWLLETLNIMEEMDIAQYEVGSAEYLHVYNEAVRIGLVDTYTYLGDPAFYELPISTLISKEFAAERAALIDTEHKTAVANIPLTDLPVTKLDGKLAEDSKHTTHICVIDENGDIVSSTNTLGNGWGCKFMAPGLGFYYNSHINNLNHDDPDSPDYVMPGKRVRSTISPSIVLKDGEPVMAIGSPGSLAIPPAIATVLNNILLYDMDVQGGINYPRAMGITRNYTTGDVTLTLTAEVSRMDADVVAALEAMGYTMKDVGDYSSSVGGIAVVYIDPDDGLIYAGGDHRRDYASVAY